MPQAEYQGMFVKQKNELEYLKKELFDKMTSLEMCCEAILKELENETISKTQIQGLVESLVWKAQYIKGLIR